MDVATKRCSKCDQTKPVDEFAERRDKMTRRVDRQAWCRKCASAYSTHKAAASVRHRLGLPESATEADVRAARWPDGVTYTHRGYVLERRRGHHRADRNGFVPQHILVAESKYGIPITRDFTVHHRDSDKANNDPVNLDLRVGNHGVHGDVIDVLLRDPALRERARTVLTQYG